MTLLVEIQIVIIVAPRVCPDDSIPSPMQSRKAFKLSKNSHVLGLLVGFYLYGVSVCLRIIPYKSRHPYKI